MDLPFDAARFFGVFARYNEAVWPAQIVLTGLAIGAVLLAFRPRSGSDRIVSGVLAFLWSWMGGVYHLGFFRAINPAAIVFGLLFLAEGIVLAVLGAWHHNLRFQFQPTVAGAFGVLLIGFALVVHPLIGHALGRRYPAAPTFGLPCPTTILTLGLLLWAEPPVGAWVLVVPLAWSAIGTSAALRLGVHEDLGLVVAGLLSALLILVPRLGRARIGSIRALRGGSDR